MGHDPLWVTVHSPHHAGYYPGAQVMTLKIAFEQETGRLLGAQVIGAAGVDKRIDVLSTAMQAGMTVFDLEQLELAYAPPYGSAKDPINMAGFVGGNLLRGDVPHRSCRGSEHPAGRSASSRRSVTRRIFTRACTIRREFAPQ